MRVLWIALATVALLLPLIFSSGAASANDAELIDRLRRRDPRALAELYDKFGRMAYALILRMVRDQAIAEDLVQETFLRVWTRIHMLDTEKGSVGPWLLAIARNRALDYLRSKAARENKAQELDETENPALYTDAEAGLLTSDRIRRVELAMQKLAPNHRQVMELAYFEGLSQTEMAERMGQPLGTVKTWMRTALKSLRTELGVAAP